MKSSSGIAVQLTLGAILAVTIVACSSKPPPPMPEPSTAWDQARVSEIAQNLADAVDALYRQEYKSPSSGGMPSALGAGDAHHEFMDTLRRVHQETRHLADELKEGAGHRATWGSIRHINMLNHDLQEFGKQVDLQNDVLNHYAKVEDLMRQLAPYYGLDHK